MSDLPYLWCIAAVIHNGVVMITNKTPVPAQRKRRLAVPLNVRVWTPIAEKLDAAVERQNTNRSDFVREAILEKLNKSAT